MKNVLGIAVLSVGLFVGCSGKDPKSEVPPAVASATAPSSDKAADVYECPMHCVPEGQTEEYTQSTPGTCPVCKMNLVKRETPK
ncbi:MAG: heavy metal-binding domain-containing protein [Polyangiales bacterium]